MRYLVVSNFLVFNPELGLSTAIKCDPVFVTTCRLVTLGVHLHWGFGQPLPSIWDGLGSFDFIYFFLDPIVKFFEEKWPAIEKDSFQYDYFSQLPVSRSLH
jgi:hypothetical protein